MKEFETHVELAHRVGIVDELTLSNVLTSSEEVGKMLRSLIRAIER
jgi:four helix bundle protein